MNGCPSCDSLERLLSDKLSEDHTHTVRQHINCCTACRRTLDRLSDDPVLRRYASRCWPPSSPIRETELVRRLEALHQIALPAPPTEEISCRPPSQSLHFLGPPKKDGDLGSFAGYRILRELGRGGMGIVLLAYDEQLQRRVALKVLRPERAETAARARFVREAQAAAGIQHDHVVTLHAVGNPPHGLPYMVIQYVDGPTLRDEIDRSHTLPPKDVARIGCQLASALAAAHRRGLVHRDVKPANIILEATSGRAKLTDFGLVKVMSGPAHSTEEGLTPGTPEYMSPEQVSGATRIDPRSDIYSLGVTLYEALTGQVPFGGVPHMILQQILRDEPRPPRRLNDKVPRDLETICLQAMAKEPGRRYQVAQQLEDDLRCWLQGKPIRARPVSAPYKLWSWCRRKPALASLTVALLLALVGVTWQWRRAERNLTDLLHHQTRAASKTEEANQERLRANQNQHNFEQSLQTMFRGIAQAHMTPNGDPTWLGPKFSQFLLDSQLRQHELHRDDPNKQLDVALGLLVAAEEERRQRGQTANTLWKYQQASNILEKLLLDHSELRSYWATCLYRKGTLQQDQSHHEDAQNSYAKARDVLEQLVRDDPQAVRYQQVLADVYLSLGAVEISTDKSTNTRASLKQARKLFQRLVDHFETRVSDSPHDSMQRGQLSAVLNKLGGTLHHLGLRREAVKAYQRAIEHQQVVVENLPQAAGSAQQLRLYQASLTRLESDIGR